MHESNCEANDGRSEKQAYDEISHATSDERNSLTCPSALRLFRLVISHLVTNEMESWFEGSGMSCVGRTALEFISRTADWLVARETGLPDLAPQQPDPRIACPHCLDKFFNGVLPELVNHELDRRKLASSLRPLGLRELDILHMVVDELVARESARYESAGEVARGILCPICFPGEPCTCGALATEAQQPVQTIRKHRGVLLDRGGTTIEVDEGIAPLLKEMWRSHLSVFPASDGYMPGWIELRFLGTKDLEEFLNIVTRRPLEIGSLIGRVEYDARRRAVPDLGQWRYDIQVMDLFEECDIDGELGVDDEVGAECQQGPGDLPYFAAYPTVSFPESDYAVVLQELIE